MKTLLTSIGNSETQEEQLVLIAKLVGHIRPLRNSKKDYSEKALLELIDILEKEDKIREDFKNVLHKLILSSDLVKFFTSNGMLSNRGFVAELRHRSTTKILPQAYPHKSIEHKIDVIFPKKNDYIWITNINDKVLASLFKLLNFDEINEEEWRTEQMLRSVNVLSYKLAGLGLEKEISERFEDSDTIVLPYIEQNRLVNKLIEKFTEQKILLEENSEDQRQLSVMLNQCLENIDRIRKKRLTIGTSLEQTFILERMRQIIHRMKLLLRLAYLGEGSRDFVPLFKRLIKNEKLKTDIIPFLKQNIGLMAYQVSEHEGNTGEHYITTTPLEYRNFFFTSTGGGLFAGIMAFIKTLLHHLPLAPFWTAFTYSLNYATGFIMIHITGSTLATKQPAMTASTIADALDGKKNQKVSLESLALVIARTSRSQFISLIGNLSVCFPLGFIFAISYAYVTGKDLVSDPEAAQMLHDIHPWQSASLLFAAIAGVYLFLGGIISGYYDNKVLYSRIPERIMKQPTLIRILGRRKTTKLAQYIEHNLGSLAGNFFLGVFLGSTAIFASFFGLGLDIRHVTISSANFGIVIYEIGPYLNHMAILTAILGLIGIGFINLLVSFGLAFLTAIWSRGITIGLYAEFLGLLKTYFFRYPLDFFIPPLNSRTIEEIWPEENTEATKK